jgi:hypothetical protein
MGTMEEAVESYDVRVLAASDSTLQSSLGKQLRRERDIKGTSAD